MDSKINSITKSLVNHFNYLLGRMYFPEALNHFLLWPSIFWAFLLPLLALTEHHEFATFCCCCLQHCNWACSKHYCTFTHFSKFKHRHSHTHAQRKRSETENCILTELRMRSALSVALGGRHWYWCCCSFCRNEERSEKKTAFSCGPKLNSLNYIFI